MKTLFENWRRYLNEQNISYSGVVLDKESEQKLLSLGSHFIAAGWEPVAHHMTITLGPLAHKKGKYDFSKKGYPVGSPIELVVLAIGKDERAMAVKVKAPNEINPKISFPHVTVAVNREGGGKPFHSNKIPNENFQSVSEWCQLYKCKTHNDEDDAAPNDEDNGKTITLKGIVTEVPRQ